MIRFSSFQILRLAPRCLSIKWEIENIPAGYTEYVTIYRSESPEGPWEPIAEELTDREYFHDWDALVRNPHVTVYYKMTGYVTDGEVPPDTEDIKDSDVEHLRFKPEAKATEIARRMNLLLKQYIGIPVYFLIRKTWGPKCGYCYSKELDKPLTDNCPHCYNTQFYGGYYEPIAGYVANQNIDKESKDFEQIKLAPEETPFWTSNYPELKQGDVFVDSQGTRWRVQRFSLQTTRLRSKMRQVFTAVRIPPEDVIYEIEVPSLYELEPMRDYYIWESITPATS